MPKSGANSLEVVRRDLDYIKEKIDAIENKIEKSYVSKDELLLVRQECFSKMESFETVRKLVYGIVTLILTGVFSALLSLVILK